MNVISNGSKWAGEAPDTVEKLIEVLKTETLNPLFEQYGNFVTKETGGTLHIFGNFCTVSHVFNMRGTAKELRPVLTAIAAARRRPEYIRIRDDMKAAKEVTA